MPPGCPAFPMLSILRAWLVRFPFSWFGRDQCLGCSEWQIFISLHWSGRCHPLQETDHCCTYSGRAVPLSFALVLFAALSLVWVAKTFSFLSTTLNLCFGVFINISAPSFASMCCKFPHHIQLLPSQPPQSPTGFWLCQFCHLLFELHAWATACAMSLHLCTHICMVWFSLRFFLLGCMCSFCCVGSVLVIGWRRKSSPKDEKTQELFSSIFIFLYSTRIPRRKKMTFDSPEVTKNCTKRR